MEKGLDRPIGVLNIGGVANVTWICGDDSLLASDTGSGNARTDDRGMRLTGAASDIDGGPARAGRVDDLALAGLPLGFPTTMGTASPTFGGRLEKSYG